jgi:hypothetical protein
MGPLINHGLVLRRSDDCRAKHIFFDSPVIWSRTALVWTVRPLPASHTHSNVSMAFLDLGILKVYTLESVSTFCPNGLAVFSRLSLFWKIKVGLCDHHAVCVPVYPPYKLLNAWTNLYETWYVYHSTWVHLNGILHKSLPRLCLYVYPPIVARQRLGKNVTAATNTHATIELLDAFYMRSVSYQGK